MYLAKIQAPRHFDVARLGAPKDATIGESVIRKYGGDKKSIEARSNDKGKTWSVKLFDAGRLSEYTGGTIAEVDELAAKHGMKLLS